MMINAAIEPPTATPRTSASISHCVPMKLPQHLQVFSPSTMKHSPRLVQNDGEHDEHVLPALCLSSALRSSYPCRHWQRYDPNSLMHRACLEQSLSSGLEHSLRSSTRDIASVGEFTKSAVSPSWFPDATIA